MNHELDYGGLAATTYGCLTVSWAPSGITLWIKSGHDLGTCVYGAYQAAEDVNTYSRTPTPANYNKLFLDSVNGILGCGLTGLGAVLE